MALVFCGVVFWDNSRNYSFSSSVNSVSRLTFLHQRRHGPSSNPVMKSEEGKNDSSILRKAVLVQSPSSSPSSSNVTPISTFTPTTTSNPTTPTASATNTKFLTCNEVNLKTRSPKCDKIKYDTLSFDHHRNPLFVDLSTQAATTAAVLYGKKLKISSESMCDLWDEYINLLGLNGLLRPLVANEVTGAVNQNPSLHMIGAWASNYARLKNIHVRNVVEIVASPVSAGAALHGVVWSHLAAWAGDRIKDDHTELLSFTVIADDLWSYAIRNLCFMANEHSALYVHCLHGLGHAFLVLSVFNSDPSSRALVNYHCPVYPELLQESVREVEAASVQLCDHAMRTSSIISSSVQRREQDAFICSDGVYMLYFEQSRVLHAAKALRQNSISSQVESDLTIEWWEPCGRNSRFAGPCFAFLFRTGVAGRRILRLPPRSRHEEPSPNAAHEKWSARRIVYPTLCVRSEARIRAYANVTFITAEQLFLACVHSLSKHLYEDELPKRGIGFLNSCSKNSLSLKKKVKEAAENRNVSWSVFPGAPREPVFSFCAKSALNIGFDKMMALKQTQAAFQDTNAAAKDTHVEEQHLLQIARTSSIISERILSTHDIAAWKACVAGISTGASFFVAQQEIPCWSVKWTLCQDAMPRGSGLWDGTGYTVSAPEMVNLCLRLALSRSAREINQGMENVIIWDTSALGF